MAIEITDDDIAYAEKLLLPAGCRFNDERRIFIRCMESRDVVACPGSGKTTALLAKLLILARKMPFADGPRGICVLTHTNVAIDEIKERAGIASASLFRYPNFFGTIHSFVGTYLAIPAYIGLFGHRQIRIDDDYYRSRAYHEFTKYDLEKNGAIFQQLKSKLEGKNWPEQREIKKEFFINLTFRFDNGYVSYLRNDTDKVVVKGSAKPSPSYRPIHDAKYGLLGIGCLRYQDVFPLATLHVSNNRNIHNLFLSRFSFLFVDEMQDSDKDQINILDSVFLQSPEIIIQRVGDPNQAIYHDRVHSGGYWSPRNPLHFSDSRRYGETITRLLSTVRLDDSVTLQPCESTASHPPYLITYQDGEEQTVILAFSCLIQELSDRLPPNSTYKAIGWIGKDKIPDGKLCIPTYFPHFDRSHRAQSKQFSNLISYTAYAIQIADTDGTNRFLEIILQGISRALDFTGIKDEMSGRNYTPASLDYFWKRENEKSYYQFQEQMAGCFLLALDSSVTPASLRNQIRSAVEPVWPMHNKAATFLDDDSISSVLEVSNGTAHAKNQFVTDKGIVIHIGTVHSVKGETHSATLYLETEYEKASDASRLIEFLKGKRPKAQIKKAYHQQNLKIAHVAFSRPTHLLAFACRASSITGHEDDLKGNGWEIRTVSELNINEGGKT